MFFTFLVWIALVVVLFVVICTMVLGSLPWLPVYAYGGITKALFMFKPDLISYIAIEGDSMKNI